MKTIQQKITNPHGLISRRAADLVSVANHFASSVTLKVKDATPADLKSIMNVFDTLIEANDVITIEIEGSDEDKACEAFERLFANETF